MTDVLADLQALVSGWSPAAKAEFDKLAAKELASNWLPSPGPQTDAYHSKADLLLYGGAAGGGKTDLLLGLALEAHKRSVIFRRAYVDLRGVEERLIEILGNREGYNGQDMVLRRGGMVLEFGALEKPGAELGWQGRPHDFIGFDEGAQLQEEKVRFVLGWMRSTSQGQRTRAVIASNPPIGGEGDWLSDWFAPWLDPLFPNPANPGELRWCVVAGSGETIWVDGPGAYPVGEDQLEALSRSYIPAKLADNPFLRDTNYRAKIMAMPEPLRSKLLKGDFLAGKEDAERQVIPSAFVEAAQARWHKGKPSGIKMLSMGVDPAGDGPDPVAIAPLWGNWFDHVVEKKGKIRGPEVAGMVVEVMRGSPQINVDMTGGYGGDVKLALNNLGKQINPVVFSEGSGETTKDGHLQFFNRRAELWWRFREALDPDSGEDIALPPDRILAAELTAPTWMPRGPKILVEGKDDIKKRLGRSTNRADAVILAWHKRLEALFSQTHGDRLPTTTADDEWDPFE